MLRKLHLLNVLFPALFPVVSRLKRDSANMTKSMVHTSVEDVGLLFEVVTIIIYILHWWDIAHGTDTLLSFSCLPVLHLNLKILLSGVQFKDSGEFSVQDAELASLHKTKDLKVICEEIVPRKHTDILKLIYGLFNHNRSLEPEDFQCTLMTLVYTSQQVANATCKWQKRRWGESFVNLYKVIKKDLTDTK